MDLTTLKPYENLSYGPLKPNVNLEPDFFTDFTPERRREIVTKEAAFYHELTEPYSVADNIETRWISFSSFDGAPLTMKMYQPRETPPTPMLPLMFFHGGGWKTCSVETHDYVPAFLAAHANVTCFSVEYRLAPENPFPCGLEDCYEASRWVVQHANNYGVDASKLVVAGDSSGGNFAAVIAQLVRDRANFSLAGQILIYPVTDLENIVKQKRSPDRYGALRGEGIGPCPLTRTYLPDPINQMYDARFAPLSADDVSHVAPALFILAECDSLVDDGLFYAERLKEAHVPVEVHVYEGMPHAFILRTYEETFKALTDIVEWLHKLEE